MPRKVSDDAVNYQQYGEVHNELPPSTMAAQLVQNHLKDDKRSQLPDRVNFRQLLEELRTLSSVDKTDVQNNLLLITVIAQAGLDPTRWNDLFNKNSNANDDVLASLEIIELVVGQNPEVLFIEAQDTNQSGSPLCLLLLPRVLALLSPRCANSDILEKVAKLLSSMVLILQRDPTQWTASASLLCLYRTCVDGLERAAQSSDRRTYASQMPWQLWKDLRLPAILSPTLFYLPQKLVSYFQRLHKLMLPCERDRRFLLLLLRTQSI